jgi:hypothetical protein
MVWTVAGGVPRSRLIGSAEAATNEFTFVQISDSHLERFPVWLNRDSQGRRKGGFLGSDSAL